MAFAVQNSKTYNPDRAVGTVTGREVRTYVIDIEAHVSILDTGADEVLIRLNGRPFKRLTADQAARAGVITQDNQ
jgi:hypothetical protein